MDVGAGPFRTATRDRIGQDDCGCAISVRSRLSVLRRRRDRLMFLRLRLGQSEWSDALEWRLVEAIASC
jgi:hypothetical protein